MSPSHPCPPVEVTTLTFDIECPPAKRSWRHLAPRIAERIGDAEPVRLICVDAEGDTLAFEASVVRTGRRRVWPSIVGPFEPEVDPVPDGPEVVVSLIPTGIRAEIGGFAGDATPSMNLLAATCDYLVTNPNTVTASDLYFARANIQYLEGNLLGRFMLGQLDLGVGRRRKVGMVIERPVNRGFRDNVLNAINAMRTVAGIDVDPVVFTGRIATRSVFADRGHASGEYGDLGALTAAVDVAHARGARAIGVVSSIEVPQAIREAYYRGEPLPNPWGSAEAILTHTVTSYAPVTAAHSPLLLDEAHTMFGTLADPRDGAEMISSAYLCSMVQGLSTSPALIPADAPPRLGQTRLTAAHVRAVVMPERAVGNIPFLAALDRRTPIILVRGNPTCARVDIGRLGLRAEDHRIHVVESYLEAAGLLVALREGIAPASLRRPVSPLEPIILDPTAR